MNLYIEYGYLIFLIQWSSSGNPSCRKNTLKTLY